MTALIFAEWHALMVSESQVAYFVASMKPALVAKNELCVAVRDEFPVARYHTLVIPRRHVANFFDLYQPELNAVYALLRAMETEIRQIDNRIAVTAAGHTATHPPAPPRDLVDAAFRVALAAIDAERRELTERVAAIRQRRTRSALAEIAERRKEALAYLREGERVLSAFMRKRQRARQEVARGRLDPRGMRSPGLMWA